jgi:predicted ArsR family transcriptional regulator
MAKVVEKIPAETRWTIATKALTSALTAASEALRDALGQEQFNEVWGRIWAEQGRACKQIADSLGITGDDAKSAVKAVQAVVTVSIGPEFKFETTDATPKKAVLRCTECTWWNRKQELGIPGELCSAACPAFCNAFGKALNPKLTVSLTKGRPKGDSYCETVWELKG